MTTERRNLDRISGHRTQQNIQDISANNGSFVFAGDVSHVSFSQPGQITHLGSFEDAVKRCRDILFVSHPGADKASVADAKGKRTPGTCSWILENPQCQAWLNKKSPLFWISGGPGMGKTVLSLFLSEQVERLCQGTDDHFLFYFCRFQHDLYNKPVNLLRSLIYQLLNFSTDMSKIQQVLSYLDSQEKADNALSSLECLWNILEILLSQPSLSIVYCLIDGIDECQSSDVLIGKFRDYCASPIGRNGPLRLAIIGRDVDLLGIPIHPRDPTSTPESTSNHSTDGIDAINVFNGIKINPDYDQHVHDDIALFTRWSLEPLQGIPDFETIRPQVEQTLLTRAEGTFLWVGFVINELSKKKTCLQILEMIQHIPAGLNPIFGRTLHQIDPKYHSISAIILKWVAMTVRPLTLGELAYAVGTDIERMADRISICQPLLKLSDGRVLLIHQSVKEYLVRSYPDQDPIAEEFRIQEKECHSEIAHRCLQVLEHSFLQHTRISSRSPEYLRGEDRQPNILRVNIQPGGFQVAPQLFNYADLHWMKHAKSSSKNSKHLYDPRRPFFKKSCLVRKNWAAVGPVPWPRAHMAAYFGILPWLQALVESEGIPSWYWTQRWRNWINAEYLGCITLLHAVVGDHEQTVRFLLRHGANMGGWHPALRTAAALDRDKIVRVLLEYGAPLVHDGCKFEGSVLTSAAHNGSIAVAQLLLDHGVDINMKDFQDQTALVQAAKHGREDLVRFLFDHGAQFDITDFRLWLAKMAGIPEPGWSTGVVQTLLQHLTNVCWASGDGGGLLCQAARFADSQVVQVCLAKGVDVNWKGPSARTALIEALLGDRSQRATDVDGCFLTRVPYVLPRMLKLNSTTLAERKAVVIVLLNHGADLDLSGDLEDGSRRPPLVCAASRGFDWAVKELIERGVDLNARATFLQLPLPLHFLDIIRNVLIWRGKTSIYVYEKTPARFAYQDVQMTIASPKPCSNNLDCLH
ncbi:NACHT ankyrin domain-containing protein [Fusarium circinatum]|uniref:NACHT ankyrin domain-containing protein n=1 Tax=Fusarium circinatum TaxID=48490 RepID=A0A8H5T7R0_FUSCI|nr:NACHT ankyrin domain-containing protein [Fusarium circinatum]